MILALGARGPGFKSRLSPFLRYIFPKAFFNRSKALDDSDKIWQAEIEQKAQTSFQNIQNCNDYKSGSDHYNFKFALRACNYEADGESYEISECPQDGAVRICSDTTVEEAEQLIGEVGKGNSYLQIPVRDLNENTPVFSDTYDTPIYQVYEHIQEKLLKTEKTCFRSGLDWIRPEVNRKLTFERVI